MDVSLMQELIKEKMNQLLRYLIRMGVQPQEAEDIVQDTLYKALLYIDSIQADKFSAWLYKVAINNYYDICRKRKAIHLPIESVVVEDEEEPEGLLLQKERREEIEAVLQQLSPLHRQLLMMKYELDFSYKEIAELVAMKEDSVKTNLFRARKQFQKQYRNLHPNKT